MDADEEQDCLKPKLNPKPLHLIFEDKRDAVDADEEQDCRFERGPFYEFNETLPVCVCARARAFVCVCEYVVVEDEPLLFYPKKKFSQFRLLV